MNRNDAEDDQAGTNTVTGRCYNSEDTHSSEWGGWDKYETDGVSAAPLSPFTV